MKYLMERSYPYILSIFATIALRRVSFGVMSDMNFNDMLGGLVTLDSIVIGFFGAIMPVILSMKNESKFVRYVFENDTEGLFANYLKVTIFSGLFSAVFSLSLYLRNSFIHLCVKSFLYTVWAFFTTLFLISTYRSLSYMISLVFSKDNFENDGVSNSCREKTEVEKELEEKYKA